MAVIKLGDLTTFAGDPSGSFLVVNDSTNTATYKIDREALLSGQIPGTASWAINALTASSADSLVVRQNLTASNALLTGTLVAQTIVAQYVTSSTELITGSTKFGTLLSNTHQFTGSVGITGSLTVIGSLSATSSWAQNSRTASYVNPLTQSVFVSGGLNIVGPITSSISGSDNLVKILANPTTKWAGIEFGWDQSPTAELKAQENGGVAQLLIKRGNSTANFQIVTPNDSFVATEIARFSAEGVGLFTNSPRYQLDVNGSGSFRNGLTVTGSLLTTGSISIIGGATINATLENNFYSVNTGNLTYGGIALRNLIQDYTGYIQTGRSGNQNGINFYHTTFAGATSANAHQKFTSASVQFGSIALPNVLTIYNVGGGAGTAKYPLILNNGVNTTNTGVGVLFQTGDESGGGSPISHSAVTAFKINLGGGFITSNLRFYTISDGANTLAEKMRISDAGNLLINTATDSGYKLDVSGSARVTNGLQVTGSLIATSISGVSGTDLAVNSPNGNLDLQSFGLTAVRIRNNSTQILAGNFVLSSSFLAGASTYANVNLIHSLTGSNTATNSSILINPTLTSYVNSGSFYGVNFNPSTVTGPGSTYAYASNLNSGANLWNLYMGGTAPNYLAGNLGIGSTALTSNHIRVSNPLTGSSTPASIYTNGSIQTGSVQASYYLTDANTANSNFALSSLYHYQARQGSLLNVSAGGSIFSQVGFFVDSTLTGASNNYAFYGNIASGSGRWNAYMGGNALNYFAGNTLIGTTTDGGYKLDVSGSIRVADNIQFGTTGTLRGFIGRPSYDNSYIVFQNATLSNSAANAALAQSSNGLTVINAASGQTLFFRIGNANNGFNLTNSLVTFNDAVNIATDTITGTKIGTATSQKIGFWNATPIIQPTTASAVAILVGGAGTNITDTDTFDGYTLKQIVKALRDIGILA